MTHWSQVPVADKTRDTTYETRLFANIDKGGRHFAKLGFTTTNYGFPVYYIEDVLNGGLKWYRPISNGWAGHVDTTDDQGNPFRVPLYSGWKASAGNDKSMIIRSRATGKQWFIWGYRAQPYLYPGLPAGQFYCGTARLLRKPDGTAYDYRTAEGNDPYICGGGFDPMPVTLAELQSSGINRALTCMVFNTFWGTANGAASIAPAGKYDNISKTGVSNGLANTGRVPQGLCWSHTLTDNEINAWIAAKKYVGLTAKAAFNVAKALRVYGCFIVGTSGYTPAVHGAQMTGITECLLNGLITDQSQIRCYEPPYSRVGSNWVQTYGHASQITYTAPA